MARNAALLLFLAFAASPLAAAEIHVMISAGFFKVYSALVPRFEQATGHRVVTTRGPSTGDSPEAIPARLARGERADMVIMDDPSRLARKGLVRDPIRLAGSQIGMVVREGAPKPDIATAASFRNALLRAKSIAYSDSGSGTYLSTQLFPKMGIAEEIAPKSRKVRGPPSGEPVAAVVARGEAEVGFQQVSELIDVPGAAYVGPIPGELQRYTFFEGAVTSNAKEPEAALALIRFLSSPEVALTIERARLAPLPPP